MMGMYDNGWCQYTGARFLFGSYSGAIRALVDDVEATEDIAHCNVYPHILQGHWFLQTKNGAEHEPQWVKASEEARLPSAE